MNNHNLHIISNPSTIEDKLSRMKQLKQSIKELQAEHDMLKDEVIRDYFNDHEEYKTAKGLLLATYKASERTTFDSKSFKEANPELHDTFTKQTIAFTFLIK